MPPELEAFALGFPLLVLHATISMALLAAGTSVYALLSPHHEIQRIREGNAAAAVSFAGIVVGLAIPLAAALVATTSLLGLGLWSVAIEALTLLGFRVIDVLLTGLPQRMREGDAPAAVVLAAVKLAAALILAASVAV